MNNPSIEKMILSILFTAVMVEARDQVGSICASVCLGQELALFNFTRHISCVSQGILDMPLIGKGKNESTKVLRINSNVPHF